MFFLSEYNIILFYLFFAFLLGCIMFAFSFFLSERTVNVDTQISYECGFSPFQDARAKFEIQFYVIAILFIIFDIEIIFLLPWLSTLKLIGSLGYFTMMVFLILLVIGFLYEWLKDALNWNK